jgi:hypothetical protein
MKILHDVDPRSGVAFRDLSGSLSVIRLPRNESLRILPKSGMLEIYESLVACEMLSRTSLERGETRRIFGDGASGGSPMYSCVGVQAARIGGVIDWQKCYSSLTKKRWKLLIKMTRRAEAAMESFADTAVIRQLAAAKDIVPFKTMSAPDSNACVKYFGAIAFGRNVFLRCHSDEDFTMSVTQIYLKGSDQYGTSDQVVAFFCFPTLGVAIPMRPGDYILFDATIPHCISSRCHNSDDIMCVSFYLKSRVVGLNDNSIPLTRDQIYLSRLHENINGSV